MGPSISTSIHCPYHASVLIPRSAGIISSCSNSCWGFCIKKERDLFPYRTCAGVHTVVLRMLQIHTIDWCSFHMSWKQFWFVGMLGLVQFAFLNRSCNFLQPRITGSLHLGCPDDWLLTMIPVGVMGAFNSRGCGVAKNAWFHPFHRSSFQIPAIPALYIQDWLETQLIYDINNDEKTLLPIECYF